MKKTLIVEDDPVLRSLTKQMLEMIKIDTITAATFEEAVKLFSENVDDINLVLCDMHLDDHTGSEVLVEIRKINPDIKVILASGIIDEMSIKRLKDEGFDDFIQKPYRMKKLHSVCKKHLGLE